LMQVCSLAADPSPASEKILDGFNELDGCSLVLSSQAREVEPMPKFLPLQHEGELQVAARNLGSKGR
jgi:hypothetical protein